MASLETDTIVAVATPPGQGGIGILRLSGEHALEIGETLAGRSLPTRYAEYVTIRDAGELIDEGLAIFFAGPNSFTGEDVVEFQVHGSPVVLQQLLDLSRRRGARLARPGEFSERAFLNDKIDLAQAEAIADLIASASKGAARAAVRALSGEFSESVQDLASKIERMRLLIEATIDFPEEEEDFLEQYSISESLQSLQDELTTLLAKTGQGRVLNEGISIALIGAPNAGKSSLLNKLSGEEAAIVTDIPGTTRDLLKVDLVLDDLAIRLVDTAGLRQTDDPVEQEGVHRARQEASAADLVICLLDATRGDVMDEFARLKTMAGIANDAPHVMPVLNKCDLVALSASDWLQISAKTGQGIDELQAAVREAVGLGDVETEFTARGRHIEALQTVASHLAQGVACLDSSGLELLAEELKLGHDALGEIVGKTTPDDLLGRIFSEFCIGK